jgi:hypothetical protein
MRRMGIEALYRRPRTNKPGPGHKIYPYLLRGIEIRRPNQMLPSACGVSLAHRSTRSLRRL